MCKRDTRSGDVRCSVEQTYMVAFKTGKIKRCQAVIDLVIDRRVPNKQSYRPNVLVEWYSS